MKKNILFAAVLTLCSGTVMAEIGAGVQIGTTGAGVDAAYAFNNLITARVGYSGYSYNKTSNYNDVDYDGKLTLSNIRTLADLSLPLGFRATGGLIFQGNKINLTGKPSGGTYTINGTTYQASDVGQFDGQIKWKNSAAPYLGLGWGSVSSTGIGFYADIGAMYQGKSKTTLNLTCGTALDASQCAQLRADGEAERIKVQDKASKYQWYPVISMGLSIGF
ncbi:hypothetical protein GCM10027046_20090 [Uliginosibacterium flavum]|uniref:Outer membrane protein beta-barrel domain-containing protein n=1 Tax=Uliginosibacterium flavum TaxID=1396831 RepID=A0ABV2TFY1_9RHOO